MLSAYYARRGSASRRGRATDKCRDRKSAVSQTSEFDAQHENTVRCAGLAGRRSDETASLRARSHDSIFYRIRIFSRFGVFRLDCSDVRLRDFVIAYASRRVKMDLNTFIVIYWYRKYRQQQRISNRRFWDETKFFNYFRMSIPTFDDLLRRVEINLTRQDTNMRASISPEEKLSICLR
ncbi:hypothetical protein QTP88_027877 [Uroleucon formosanum]